MKLRSYIQELHQGTSRNYLARMNDNKVEAMMKARQFDFDYWDGSRRYGYGGYRYIPGRWRNMAQRIIHDYSLTSHSKILDVGAGKGYLLYEIQLLLPGIEITALDVSAYAIKNIHPDLSGKFILGDASNLNFENRYFDLAISLNTLHNLNLKNCISALSELNRVSMQQYIVVESFRNVQEFFNLQCWALTAELLLSTDDWHTLFELAGYRGDYEWIFFE
jgi:SAM-dependent methyltransferase